MKKTFYNQKYEVKNEFFGVKLDLYQLLPLKTNTKIIPRNHKDSKELL